MAAMREIGAGLAVLLALGAGAPSVTAQESHRVVAVAQTYTPSSVEVRLGGSVTLVNADPMPSEGHSLTQFGRQSTFDSGVVPPGRTGEVEGIGGLAAGTYEFFCQVHPFMRGQLTVTS